MRLFWSRRLQGESRNRSMAQRLKGLWERVQGKWRVKRICNNVFKELAGDQQLMALADLQVAILQVYNSLNKELLSPYKEPPSASAVAAKINEYGKEKQGISEDEFYELILEWARKDLQILVANKIILASLAAPSLVVVTKNAGKRVSRIGHVVEKIPAAVLFLVYSAGLVLLQDVRAD